MNIVNKITNFINDISNQLYLNEKELNEIKELLLLYETKNINIAEYITTEYNKLLNEWKENYPMFDIPNGILSISINKKIKNIKVGNKALNDNTLFDIASITKLYTEVILLKIIDRKDYNITLDTKISDITLLYPNLDKTLTILDLILFNNTYKTKEDLRECQNKEEALKRLREVYIVPELKGYYLYTDIPIMILTDILENYTKLSYKELFDKYIIKELNLKDTFLILNDEDKKRYIGYEKSSVNDPKANIMGGYYGHAGVKTTSNDLIKFMDSVFDTFKNDVDIYKIITSKTNTKEKNYYNDGTKIESEDKQLNNINKHITTIGRALIGNFNITSDIDILKDYIPTKLASSSLSKIGFAVQGSTRVHAETSIINLSNKQYKTSISILLDISNQYKNAKKYEEITGNIITKEGKTDYIEKYYMTDIRAIFPYNGIYKEIVNLVSRCRLLEIYIDTNK